MSEPFLGQIMMFGGNFAPRGWAHCNGQILAISQNSALFSLLGTIYGGDGRTSFALPDLRGRSPVHPGQGPGLTNVRVGQRGGAEYHSLTVNEMPEHSHTATLHGHLALAHSRSPNNRYLAVPPVLTDDGTTFPIRSYADHVSSDKNIPMAPESIAVSDSGSGHSFALRNPYLGIYFIIALEGIFPSRS